MNLHGGSASAERHAKKTPPHSQNVSRVGLKPNQKMVGYFQTLMPLLQQLTSLARTVIIVAFWVHSWIKLLIIFCPTTMHVTFQHDES